MTGRITAAAPARTARFDAAQSGVVPAMRATLPAAHQAFAPRSTATGGSPAVATHTARGISPSVWEERAAEAHERAVSEEAAQFRTQARLPFWNPVLSLLLGGALFVAILFAGVVMFVDPSGNVLLEAQPADVELSIDGDRVPGETSPFYINRLRSGDHELSIHKPGFQDRRQTFHVEPGETLRLPVIELLREGQAPSAPAAAEPAPPAETPAPAKTRSARGDSARSDSAQQPRSAALTPSPSPSASPAAEPSTAPTPRGASAPNPDADLLEAARPAASADPEPEAPAVAGGDNIGLLRVNSLPWSQVFVDGRLVGNTPLLGVPLKAGEHRVELVNQPMGLTKMIRVSIHKDEIVTKIVNLGE